MKRRPSSALSPLLFALLAIYVTGLLLLDRRQNGTRIADGNVEMLATNDLDSSLTTIVLRKRSRWSDRDPFPRHQTVQRFGRLPVSSRSSPGTARRLCVTRFHRFAAIGLHPKETLGEVKDRLQREVLAGDLPAPNNLKGKVAVVQLLTA